VAFEDGISMPVLKNRATCYKNFPRGIKKLPKKSTLFKSPPAHKTLACISIGEDFVPQSLQDNQKSKFMELVSQRGFIDWTRLWL
jgi:hypothetical protein